MVREKKIVVVLPAYNAAKTLANTYREIPLELVDEVILVDDASTDHTAKISQELKIKTIIHKKNSGYGANQKSCYAAALDSKADIIIMLHPDYQYTPKLIGAMVYLLLSNEYDLVLGSRILGGKARQGGMPLYKYISNRFLTLVQNILMGAKLSDTTRDTVRTHVRFWKAFHGRITPIILFLTINSLLRQFMRIFG